MSQSLEHRYSVLFSGPASSQSIPLEPGVSVGPGLRT